jgi:hypothetical protein
MTLTLPLSLGEGEANHARSAEFTRLPNGQRRGRPRPMMNFIDLTSFL